MPQPVEHLHEVDLAALRAAVGAKSFARGRTYARDRVVGLEWDADASTLRASVRGHGGLYRSTARFAPDARGIPRLTKSSCTCPMVRDCKHVAAGVIAAVGERSVDAGRVGPPPPRTAAWERPLLALIGEDEALAHGTPLAIELSLGGGRLTGTEPSRLIARPMRPSARGGWVNGSLTWSSLHGWRSGDYRDDHAAALRGLHAAEQARRAWSPMFAFGGYRDNERTLDLTDVGPQLWPLLEQARAAGVTLIHADKGLGELPPITSGAVVLDVVGAEDGLRVVPGLVADGLDRPRPLLFLGTDGHGAVCVDGAEDADPRRLPLHLVRLQRPAPPALQRLFGDAPELRVPAADVERFRHDVSPALTRVATLTSSDGAFTAPTVTGPELVLHVAHEPTLRLRAEWRWRYRLDGRERDVPAAGPARGAAAFRDRRAEGQLVSRIAVDSPRLRQLGLLGESGHPRADAVVELSGLEAMHVVTEELPALAEHPEICVDVVGERPDYRDVTDALTIGVSTAAASDSQDWFDLGVALRVEDRELPFVEVFAALVRGEQRLLLDDGAHVRLDSPQLQTLRRLIDEARALNDAAPSGGLRLTRHQTGLWEELAALGVVTSQARAWERHVAALRELDDLADHEPPRTLQATLRPYQLEGFRWLATLWQLRLGGILADDMGLGKTLQTLALICHARERDPALGPVLVVAPTSVVANWVTEAARFAPGLRVAATTGTQARCGQSVAELAAADVVVTTYTLVRLEPEAYRTVPWAAVVLDEAQAVKNHQSKTYRCVRELDAPFKLAITGTPLENTLMELWALLSITAPGLFPDPKRFAEHYARPIERRADAERLAVLRRRIRPLVKRRTKELVAQDLPSKQEQVLDVSLHPRHRKVYDTHLQRERQRILALLDEDFERHRFTILRSITLLRQLSLHPGLVDERHASIPSAKLTALVEQLQDVVGGGHRALIFSQFTSFLRIVRDRLRDEGIGTCYLDGGTRDRARVVQRFADGDDPVFLISLKAGGSGLNLMQADYCFLLDPWWNPAVEAQAIDRTHRIGQTRPVMVYRLVAANTIEEKVVALAERKAQLSSGVLDDGDLFAGTVTAADIRGLLT